MEFLSETGAERAVATGAVRLEQEIVAAPRPAYLLRFIHPAVDQEIGGTARMRSLPILAFCTLPFRNRQRRPSISPTIVDFAVARYRS